MRRIFWIIMSAMVFCANLFVTAAGAPNGFVVWSEGSFCERELKLNKIENGRLGPKHTAVKKGVGADFWVEISFDGKWIAWARSIDEYSWKYGWCDFHFYDKFDIYVSRIDGALPAKPIKIGHGYWPSWADDSHQPAKTLYFTNYGQWTIQKTTIRPDGSFSKPITHCQIPHQKLGTNAQAMISPNGKYIAYRPGKIKVHSLELQKDISTDLGGEYPCWGPRSRHLIRAHGGGVFLTSGDSVKKLGKAGLDGIGCGFSNDAFYDKGKLWIAGPIGMGHNRATPVQFTQVDISGGGWKAVESTKIGEGTSADIHIYSEPVGISFPRTNLFVRKSVVLTIQTGPNNSGLNLFLHLHNLYGEKSGLFDILGKKKSINPKSLYLP